MTDQNRKFAILGRVLDRMHEAASVLAVLCLLGVTLMITLNVVMRAMGGSGIRGVIEISEILMAAIAYFAIGAAQWGRQHVAITAATSFLSPAAQGLITRLGLAIAFLYVLVADWEAAVMAAQSYAEGESRWGIVSVPVWPGRIVVAVGFFMLAVEQLRQVICGETTPQTGVTPTDDEAQTEASASREQARERRAASPRLAGDRSTP